MSCAVCPRHRYQASIGSGKTLGPGVVLLWLRKPRYSCCLLLPFHLTSYPSLFIPTSRGSWNPCTSWWVFPSSPLFTARDTNLWIPPSRTRAIFLQFLFMLRLIPLLKLFALLNGKLLLSVSDDSLSSSRRMIYSSFGESSFWLEAFVVRDFTLRLIIMHKVLYCVHWRFHNRLTAWTNQRTSWLPHHYHFLGITVNKRFLFSKGVNKRYPSHSIFILYSGETPLTERIYNF